MDLTIDQVNPVPLHVNKVFSVDYTCTDSNNNKLYSLPSVSVPDASDVMVFSSDGSSSFVNVNSFIPPSNPNVLVNDSSNVQASGVLFVSDNTTVGGCIPTENLTVTDQTSSINILNNASLVFQNTLTGYNYNVNIDDSGYLNINNSVKQQQINFNSSINIDGALTLQGSSPLNFVDVGTNIQVFPQNGNLQFKGASDSYNFDVNVYAPNLLTNPLQVALDAGNQSIGNLNYLQLNDQISQAVNQYTIQGDANVLNFSGASIFHFSSDVSTEGALNSSNGLNITGTSALHGAVNVYSFDDETKVSTITENINGDLIIYNNNNGQVNIQNASLIGLQAETHVIGASLYIDKSDKSWHMGVDENTGQALFNGASSYGFDNNILTSGSVNADQGLTSGSSVNINNNSGLYFNNVLTSNYSVINSDGMTSDNLLINTQGSGQVLINSNQVQTCVSGATVARPSPVPVGFQYFDTDLHYPIWWSDLGVWCNSLGAPV